MLYKFFPILLPLLLAACQADPPDYKNGSVTPIATGNFASLARCIPDQTCANGPCAEKMLNAPNGTYLDMAKCRNLEVVFTGGVIWAQNNSSPDIAFHLGQNQVMGSYRVEASADGSEYQILGFIGALQAGSSLGCLATIVDKKALFSLDRCHTQTNISFLRITAVRAGGQFLLDAIEALSFAPTSVK